MSSYGWNNNNFATKNSCGKGYEKPCQRNQQKYNMGYQTTSFDRVYIKDLTPGPVINKIIGLVISKYETRSFPDKKNVGKVRCSMTFIIRDSPEDFVNVICWGQADFITGVHQSFKIGDVVELENCMVQLKQNNEYEGKYQPITSSAFQLTVSENHSKVYQFSGSDFSEFSCLAYLPIRDANDYYTINDLQTNRHNFHDTYLNILAVVMDPGTTKDITTKTGRCMKRREVKLFDETSSMFPLVIWDAELADLADTWTGKESVLFISDVRVTFEEFRQKMVATCTSKTIIITNPDTPEAHHLFNYAQSIKSFGDDVNTDEINLSSIRDVYTLLELEEKITTDTSTRSPFQGIVYAYVNSFDIDGDENCVVTRCATCKQRVERFTQECTNQCGGGECVSSRAFEIRVSLSDHTNGLAGFSLTRSAAENILGVNVDTFCSWSEQCKTDLKWKYLLERFKIYFKVLPSFKEQRTFLSIMALHQFDI